MFGNTTFGIERLEATRYLEDYSVSLNSIIKELFSTCRNFRVDFHCRNPTRLYGSVAELLMTHPVYARTGPYKATGLKLLSLLGRLHSSE